VNGARFGGAARHPIVPRTLSSPEGARTAGDSRCLTQHNEAVIPRRAYFALLLIPVLVILDVLAKRLLWAWFG